MEEPMKPAPPVAAPGNQQVQQIRQSIAEQVAELKRHISEAQLQSLKAMMDTIHSVFDGLGSIPAPNPSMPQPPQQPPFQPVQPPAPPVPSMQQANDAVSAAIAQANREMQQALDLLDSLEVPSAPEPG